MTRLRALVAGLVLTACAGEPPFDFGSACSMAEARASSPGDLRRITDTINDASNGDYQPRGDDVERWKAAVLLGEAAREAAAPYAVPSEFQRNLPKQPDTTEVRRLQQRLATACHDQPG